ncbi:MAG: nucleotidyltransferase family protein [bacterium]
MQLVILSGGMGTRLGLTDIPKPMVKIGDKSILEHQINLARKYGIKDIIIISGHLSGVIIDYFGDGKDFGVNITHITEPYPLGTAGCLKLIKNIIDERFLIFYGDLFLDFDIESFIESDRTSEAIATVIVQPNDYPYDSDLLEINDKKEVTAFHPKPRDKNEYRKNLVNAAVYILSRDILNHIKENEAQDFGKDIFPALLKEKIKIKAYKTSEYLKDLGTPDRFEEVKQDFIFGKISSCNKKNKRKAVFFELDEYLENLFADYPHINDQKAINDIQEFVKKINKSNYLSIMIRKSASSYIENNLQEKIETIFGQKNAYIDETFYLDANFIHEIEKTVQQMNIDVANSFLSTNNKCETLILL